MAADRLRLDPLLLPAAVLVGAIVLAVVRRPEYGLALAVAITPLTGLEIGQPLGPNVSLPREPFKLLLPLIVFGVLVYGALLEGPDRRKLPAVFVGIMLLIGAALISSLRGSSHPSRSRTSFCCSPRVPCSSQFSTSCRTRDQLLVVVAGALCALLIASVHGSSSISRESSAPRDSSSAARAWGECREHSGTPTSTRGFLAMLLPLAVAIVATKELPSQLRLLAGVAALAAGAQLLLRPHCNRHPCARGADLAVDHASEARRDRSLIVAVAAVSLAPAVLKERFNPESAEGDVALRTDVAQSALDIYSEHPLLGVGVNNFQTAYSERMATETAGQRRLLHNEQLLVPTAAPSQYLNTLAEQGLVGLGTLAIFALLALGSAWRVSKARDRAVRGLGLGVGIAIFAVVLNSLAQISLQEVQAVILFTLLGIASTAESAFAGSGRRSARRVRDESPGHPRLEWSSLGGSLDQQLLRGRLGLRFSPPEPRAQLAAPSSGQAGEPRPGLPPTPPPETRRADGRCSAPSAARPAASPRRWEARTRPPATTDPEKARQWILRGTANDREVSGADQAAADQRPNRGAHRSIGGDQRDRDRQVQKTLNRVQPADRAGPSDPDQDPVRGDRAQRPGADREDHDARGDRRSGVAEPEVDDVRGEEGNTEGHRGGHLQGHSGRDQQPLDHRSPHPPGLELGDHRQHQIDHRQSERLDRRLGLLAAAKGRRRPRS